MPDPSDPTAEGRLLALRQVLALILAGRDRAAILDWLDAGLLDGQEDPGAVENPAFAVEGALAAERLALAREVRLRLAGGTDTAAGRDQRSAAEDALPPPAPRRPG
jgi:hypothetical protein